MRQIIIALYLMLSIQLTAQTFEIRLINKGSGEIGVEMRETSGIGTPSTTGFVTDLVFGIKWSTTYNVDLNAINNTNYNIGKSGSRETNGGFHYQAFGANATPFNFPNNWTQNNWEEIITIFNDQQTPIYNQIMQISDD